MTAQPTKNKGPLAGYRVLELGSTVAGPFCGRLFADFGAEVIKVEAADGDPVRSMGKRYRNKSLWAASIFRNKSLIGVDLRKPQGQELVKTIDDIITRWTLKHTCAEAEKKLHAAEVPAARIYTMADIFADPHYAARGMLAKVADDDLGTVTMPDVVPKLSMTPGAIRHSGHRVGQDTRKVLTELTGLSAAKIDQLESEHVITCDTTADAASGVEASEAS